jgi:hypothetical protein
MLGAKPYTAPYVVGGGKLLSSSRDPLEDIIEYHQIMRGSPILHPYSS